MDLKTLDDLQATLQKAGADAAIDRLCAELKAGKDFHGLFYAMLMKTRHALGVSPVPTGSGFVRRNPGTLRHTRETSAPRHRASTARSDGPLA